MSEYTINDIYEYPPEHFYAQPYSVYTFLAALQDPTSEIYDDFNNRALEGHDDTPRDNIINLFRDKATPDGDIEEADIAATGAKLDSVAYALSLHNAMK